MHLLNCYTAAFYMLIGIAIAVPIPNAALEEVSRIASQPCPNDGNPQNPLSLTPSPASTQTESPAVLADRLIRHLKIVLNETTYTIQVTLDTIRQWSSLVDSRNRQKLLDYLRQMQLPAREHDALSSEVNSKLRVQEQLSIYVYFITKLENDAAYNPYGMNGTALFKNIRNKITIGMCILRGLLPLSGDEIRNYAIQDADGHLVSLGTTNAAAAIKRATVSVAVNMMFETMKQIEVSVETGSVIMPANV